MSVYTCESERANRSVEEHRFLSGNYPALKAGGSYCSFKDIEIRI